MSECLQILKDTALFGILLQLLELDEFGKLAPECNADFAPFGVVGGCFGIVIRVLGIQSRL